MSKWFSRMCLSLTLVCCLVASPPALGWHYWPSHYPYTHSWAVHSYGFHCYPRLPTVAVPVCFTPTVPYRPLGPAYATPTPAPPSAKDEPKNPTNPSRPPAMQESRALRLSPGAIPKTDLSAKRCRVGFWNVSGRALVLTINGQKHRLERNRSLTLELARQFVWQREGRPEQTEQVPESQASYEIVLRP